MSGVMLILHHPAYQLDDDDRVVVGGTFRANLDAEWYRLQCKQAAEYGVDPLLFIGFSLVEYGGYRVGTDHDYRAADRGLSHVPTGRNFVSENGASGVQLGDALHSGVLAEEVVQLQLKALGAREIFAGGVSGFDPAAAATQEQMDRQSFMLLKRLQDTALKAQNLEYYWQGKRLRYRRSLEPSIAFGLQSLHGYGQLPYLYRAGQFGHGKLVRYRNGKLEPGFAGSSGVKGTEHPIYGYSLAWFIHQMNKNPAIKQLMPPGSKLPVTQAVIRDFRKSKVRGLRPAR